MSGPTRTLSRLAWVLGMGAGFIWSVSARADSPPRASAKPVAQLPSATARTAPAAPQWDRLRQWVESWRKHQDRHRMMRQRRLHLQLNRVLNGAPIPAEVRTELAENARRTARLNRLKELAILKQDAKALEKVQQLLKREHARHQRWYLNFTGVKR
jgi:hypothetical protein